MTDQPTLPTDPDLTDGHLRPCLWPDCPALFDTIAVFSGQARPLGWHHRVLSTGYLCPTHSKPGHLPSRENRQATCECGWHADEDGATLGAIQEQWRTHIRSLPPAPGPASVTYPLTATVAATLRQIAGWGIARPTTDYEWSSLATRVETVEPGWCCPLCQEIICDDDCPLAPLQLDRYPWTPPAKVTDGSPHVVAGEGDYPNGVTSSDRRTSDRGTRRAD